MQLLIYSYFLFHTAVNIILPINNNYTSNKSIKMPFNKISVVTGSQAVKMYMIESAFLIMLFLFNLNRWQEHQQD